MNLFIVIKMVMKDKKSRQYMFRRMSLSNESDTVFEDYVNAEIYAGNFENTHIILNEDFQQWMSSLDLIARTVKARDCSLCTG